MSLRTRGSRRPVIGSTLPLRRSEKGPTTNQRHFHLKHSANAKRGLSILLMLKLEGACNMYAALAQNMESGGISPRGVWGWRHASLRYIVCT
jgi:hypothetical protein